MKGQALVAVLGQPVEHILLRPVVLLPAKVDAHADGEVRLQALPYLVEGGVRQHRCGEGLALARV
eukprot:2370169-Alexandrium_andersonii.AAC.1